MNIEFSIINYESTSYEDVLDLRHRILRLPLGMNLYEEDLSEDKDQYIIIGIENKMVVACLMLKILDKDTIKFRQMAVDTLCQQKGMGAMLIRYAENFCFLNDYTKVELHARKSAEGFYSKLHYQIQGSEFLEVGIPHVKMTKELTN